MANSTLSRMSLKPSRADWHPWMVVRVQAVSEKEMAGKARVTVLAKVKAMPLVPSLEDARAMMERERVVTSRRFSNNTIVSEEVS